MLLDPIQFLKEISDHIVVLVRIKSNLLWLSDRLTPIIFLVHTSQSLFPKLQQLVGVARAENHAQPTEYTELNSPFTFYTNFRMFLFISVYTYIFKFARGRLPQLQTYCIYIHSVKSTLTTICNYGKTCF